MGKLVESIYLSVDMSGEELKGGYEKGDLVSVLIYAGTTPFKYNWEEKLLILRRAAVKNGIGPGVGTPPIGNAERLERISILAFAVEERITG